MCFGGSNDAADQAAEAAAKAEAEAAEREANILSGKEYIDEAFAQFDDDYYDTYSQSIIDYQTPQLEEQYSDAQGDLVAALARRGMLESTFGANETADLDSIFSEEAARIADNASNEALNLRSGVENSKSDLYALNEATADPGAISTQAIGQATSLAAPAATSDIGQVFADLLAPYTAYNYAQMYSTKGTQKTNTAPVASGAGSSRIVSG